LKSTPGPIQTAKCPSIVHPRSATRKFIRSAPYPLPLSQEALFLFGGLDDLGAQSALLFRMALPAGENYTTARPEWVEWDSELPYNKNRSCAFNRQGGSLSVLQVGAAGRLAGVGRTSHTWGGDAWMNGGWERVSLAYYASPPMLL